jgi:hypothetical protein
MLCQQLEARLNRVLELRIDDEQDGPGVMPIPTPGVLGFDDEKVGKIYTIAELGELLLPKQFVESALTDNDPRSVLSDGEWGVIKNTLDGTITLWVVDGGQFGGVNLFTPLSL